MAKSGMKVRKAKPKSSECKCIEQVNEQLAPHNGKIAQRFQFSLKGSAKMSSPIIETERLDKTKRKNPPTLIAAHCPFCGKKYPE